jgi:hypothetical protein
MVNYRKGVSITNKIVPCFLFIVLIILVGFSPYWFASTIAEPTSQAQVAGYDNNLAYLMCVAWFLIAAAVYYALQSSGRLGSEQQPLALHQTRHWGTFRDFAELGLVLVGLLLLLFPPVFARYGPFLEENINLNAVQRMMAGDVPFADFEYLYAPSMIYLSYFWMKLVGYSSENFYWYIYIVEAVAIGSLAILVQLQTRSFWQRVFGFPLRQGSCPLLSFSSISQVGGIGQ